MNAADYIIANAAVINSVPVPEVRHWLIANQWDLDAIQAGLDGPDGVLVQDFFIRTCGAAARRFAEAQYTHRARRDRAKEEQARRESRRTPDAKRNPDLICGKCDGLGRINAFSHIEAGACFQCRGSGIIRPRGRRFA